MSQENVNIERVGGAAVSTTLPVSGSVSVTGVATAANQATEIASLANLDVALSTRTKPSDQQHVIVDSSAAVAVTVAALPNEPNLDVALSTRLKPGDTLTGVTTLTSITNPVAVTLAVAPTTAVTIADGSSVVEGLTTDAAVQGDTLGTISAKLRGINIALQQLQQSQARNIHAQMAQFAANQQPGAGFVIAPEVPAFLGGF